ncbi:hypothetical protein ACGFIF_30235 [Kribbella sp. NPDC049174]
MRAYRPRCGCAGSFVACLATATGSREFTDATIDELWVDELDHVPW